MKLFLNTVNHCQQATAKLTSHAESVDNNVTIYIAGNKSRGANKFGLGMGGVGRTHPSEN